MRASANVIHPRSSGGNADKERASVASVVPSSFMAFGGATSSNSFSIRLIIPILEVSCGLHERIFNETVIPPGIGSLWRSTTMIDIDSNATWAGGGYSENSTQPTSGLLRIFSSQLCIAPTFTPVGQTKSPRGENSVFPCVVEDLLSGKERRHRFHA
jgi:hypothetical protein